MKKVIPILEIKHFVECPHCKVGRTQINHLFGRETTFGIWFCDDCGGGYKGKVKGQDVFIEKVNERKDKCIVFLKNNNVMLVVEGMYFDGELSQEYARYYYEEHTCPINYLKDVLEVIDLKNNDRDPHGIFEFVKAIPFTDLDQIEDMQSLL